MNFHTNTPTIHLKPFIKRFWSVEVNLLKNEVHTQRVVATGLPELSFYFGSQPFSTQRSLSGSALLNVQQNDFFDLQIPSNSSIFAITFQPHGLNRFLRIPLNELKNFIITSEIKTKDFFPSLEAQLSEANNFHLRTKIAERYFLNLLNYRDDLFIHEGIANSIHQIKKTKANISIDTLALDACMSRKQFERKFSENIGISPKQYLKIIRFQNSIKLNQSNKNLTTLAYEAGYFDQSHFVKQIKELTGYTPKILFEKETLVSDFFG
jgi:AraC-like DNA-binding protein